MYTAFARIQAEIARLDLNPADLNINLSDKDPISFICDRQNSLSPILDFPGVVQFTEIQNLRFKFQPGGWNIL